MPIKGLPQAKEFANMTILTFVRGIFLRVIPGHLVRSTTDTIMTWIWPQAQALKVHCTLLISKPEFRNLAQCLQHLLKVLVVANPQPSLVVRNPQSSPVVMNPQPSPVVINPQPSLVVIRFLLGWVMEHMSHMVNNMGQLISLCMGWEGCGLLGKGTLV